MNSRNARRIGIAALAALALAASSVASSASANGAATWKPTKLGWGYAYDINEQGQLVGEDDGEALLWQDGKPGALEAPESLGKYEYTFGGAINDSGAVAGGTWGGPRYALLWGQDGAARALPPLTRDDYNQASDINNSGQVVGWSGFRAVLWQDGKPQGLPGRACDEAVSVNDAGTIVGVVSTRCDQYNFPRYPRAVLWEAGTPRILVNAKSEAVAINNLGQIVGWRKPTWAKLRRGFLWENGIIRDLGSGFLPEAINDRGQIVGSCGKRACVWESGKLTKLGELGYHDAVATAINERQQIVGYAISGGGELRELGVVLLWTFTP